MSENSKIEWCHHTINLWRGCDRVSPGCVNCYAEAIDKRFAGGENWKGKRNDQREGGKKLALSLNRKAERLGIRYRVFNGSMNDWLDDKVPIKWLVDLLDLIRITPHLDWLLLTKRPANWKKLIDYANTAHGCCDVYWFLENWLKGKPPANVWIGTTVEDQTRADERIPLLLQIPAEVRFLSCEPLLGPVDLSEVLYVGEEGGFEYAWSRRQMIHWVICGGESGSKARPMHPDWARSLRDQCQAADVPFLFKQWGEHAPCPPPVTPGWDGIDVKLAATETFNPRAEYTEDPATGIWLEKVGKKKAGRLLDGREWNEFPEVKP